MDYVILNIEHKIATVTINRPPVNALNGDLYREIAETMDQIDASDEVSVAILRSEGRGFSAGNDVSDIHTTTRANHHAYQKVIAKCMSSVMECRVPVIAAVQGYALGAGCCLAASCDMLIASDDAYFGLPEVTLSIVGGAGFLSMIMPEKMVNYVAYSGKNVTAQTLHNYGSILSVVTRDRLMYEVNALASVISKHSQKGLSSFKKAMSINRNQRMVEQFYIETLHTDGMLETPAKDECTAAFFEKRSPNFDNL